MRAYRDESGQVLVLTALSLTVILGFMALAIDVGLLFRARWNMQIAADAAAIAGAMDYLYNQSSTSAVAAAKAAAAQNGVTDGSNGAVVNISTPPADGPNAGNAAYVEASVYAPNPTFFMKLFHVDLVNVSARAVAGTPTATSACIWLTKTSGTALYLQGSYDIESPGCGIYVNSPTSNAISITGGGGTVNASYLNVVGNSIPSHQTSPTPATLNVAPRTNPFGNLTGPTPANGGCGAGNTNSVTTVTSSTSLLMASGVACFSKSVTLSAVTLGPGIYVFENGVTISGQVTVNSGTLDIYSGSFNQSNGTLSLTAPTSGTYNGIAVMQPASNTNQLQIQFGSSNETLDGMIYAPGAQLYMQDHGGGVSATGVVAASLYIKSSILDIPSYAVAHPSTAPNRAVTLVE